MDDLEHIRGLLQAAAESTKEAEDEFYGDCEGEERQDMLDITAVNLGAALFDLERALTALEEAGANVVHADPEQLPQMLLTMSENMPKLFAQHLASVKMIEERLSKKEAAS